MRYQQNMIGRKIAFVGIGNQQWPILRLYTERVVAAVNAAKPGSFTEVEIPFRSILLGAAAYAEARAAELSGVSPRAASVAF